MKKNGKKLLSMLLTAALVVSGGGTTVPALAAGSGGTGLCEHHPAHTKECGYREADPGAPCMHEHTEDCYAVIPEATPGDASPSNADAGGEKVLICPHARGIHDETCGYREKDPGAPCTFVCEECGRVSYMDENGELRYEQVGSLQTVSAKENRWKSEGGEQTWYYLDRSVTFSGDNARILVEGNVALVLGRNAVLTAGRGIDVPEGSTLTIYGQSEDGGRLIAVSDSMGAAIGGPSNGTKGAGKIVINSGTVEATVNGAFGAAGIGGGYASNSSAQVEINGGVVKATGGSGGPGIGNVIDFAENSVTITGGTVTAAGGTYETDGIRDSAIARIKVGGAGIGGGSGSGSGEITITGGTVTAAGGAGAPGIGSGSEAGGAGIITIAGENTAVTAKGSSDGAAGIGGGRTAYSGTIEIADGARVTASGGRTAIDGEVDPDGLYDGDYIVLGGRQGADDKEAVALRAGGVDRDVRKGTDYKYLEFAPVTIKSVGVSPETVSAKIGDRIPFAVKLISGSHEGADLTRVLDTAWTVTGAAGAEKNPHTTIDADGVLQIGGDETLETLTVSAGFDEMDGVKVVSRDSRVNVYQVKYTVSFNANGGTAGTAAMRTTKGRLTAALPTAERTGYTFDGWYTQAAGGSRVDDGYVFNSDTTLYAHWKINSYTVTYNSMGGSLGIFTRTVNYAGKAPTPAVPVKDRSVFEGWYTDLSYTRRWNFDADCVTGNTTLYAKWSDAVLEVRISADASPAEGGRALYGGVYRMGAEVTLKAEAAAGYRFLYWTENGQIVSYSTEYGIKAEEDRSLTAVFEKVVVVLPDEEETAPGSGSGNEGSAGGSQSSSSGSTGSGSSGSSHSAGSGSSAGSGGSSHSGSSGGGSGRGGSSGGGGSRGGSSGSGHSSGGSSGGSRSSGSSSGSSGAGSASGSTEANQDAETAQTLPFVPDGEKKTIVTTVTVDAAETSADTAAEENVEVLSAAWVQDEQGDWALQYSDGTVASNSWVCVNESDGAHWYHFGLTGRMDTGWLNLGGKWYYLQADHNGGAGRMLTGWQLVNGKWYYFSIANDGTVGTMLANTMTPDGFWVNESGEWVQ